MTFFESVKLTTRALFLSWTNFDKLYWYRLKTAVKTIAVGIWYVLAPLLFLLGPIIAIAVYFVAKADEEHTKKQLEEMEKQWEKSNIWK